jgi:hypothetical protein
MIVIAVVKTPCPLAGVTLPQSIYDYSPILKILSTLAVKISIAAHDKHCVVRVMMIWMIMFN